MFGCIKFTIFEVFIKIRNRCLVTIEVESELLFTVHSLEVVASGSFIVAIACSFFALTMLKISSYITFTTRSIPLYKFRGPYYYCSKPPAALFFGQRENYTKNIPARK